MRSRLTSATITAAALAVLDESGVDGLNMRAVADRLGTGAASLYRHVASKQDLLDLLVEDAVRGVRLPDPGMSWRTQLAVLAHGIRAVLTAHRDLARVAMTSSTVSPGSLRVAEAVLTALVSAGCPRSTASVLLDRFSLYVTADAFEASLWRERMSAPEARAHWDAVANTYASLDPVQYPQLIEHADVITRASPDERFAEGLETLLDGIESRLPR